MSHPPIRPSLPHRSSVRNLFILAVAVLSPATGWAWTWEMVPSVDAGLSYETNPDNFYEQSREDDAYIASLRGQLGISASTPDSKLKLDPSIRIRQNWGNAGNHQLNGSDFSLPLSLTTRGRRSQTSVSAGYSLLPSRTADYQVTNPGEPLPPGGVGCNVDISSGRCRVDEYQTNWHVGPSLTYDLTPLTQLSLDAQHSEVSYDKARITKRFDYDYNVANLSVSHMLHPRHQVNASASFARFDANQPGSTAQNKTDTTSFNLGYEYIFSPETSINLKLGSSFSDYRVTRQANFVIPQGSFCVDDWSHYHDPVPSVTIVPCTSKGNDSGFVGELFLVQKLPDRISTRIGVSRQVQPSSDGAQVAANTLTAFVERDLSSRLRASVGISYTDQESVGSKKLALRQQLNRTYGRLDLGLRWQLSRHWYARASYAYNTDKYDVQYNQDPSFSIDSRNQMIDLGVTWVGRTYR